METAQVEVIRHMARDTEVVEEGGLTHAALIATLAMMELLSWILCPIDDEDDIRIIITVNKNPKSSPTWCLKVDTSDVTIRIRNNIGCFKIICRSFLIKISTTVQGDTSRCPKPPVDFKTKVSFWPGMAMAWRNFCF